MSGASTHVPEHADDPEAIRRISEDAEHRGGLAQRRIDGAYFTDDDVATHLVRRAIGAALLESAGVDLFEIDVLLARGTDLVDRTLQLAAADPVVEREVRERLASLRVLDPSCGAGSFLRASWRVLRELDAGVGGGAVRMDQLLGIDIDAAAVDACLLTLRLEDPAAVGFPCVVVGDAQVAGVLPAADIVVGNPPYVRASSGHAHRDLATAGVTNRSAWIVERSLRAAKPGARIAFVLPVSTACTDAFAPARAVWDEACSSVHTCHFDTIPSSLFEGVVQRLSIFEGRRSGDGDTDPPARWFTSRYHRWTRDERAGLLDRIRMVELPSQSVGGSIAKVGTELERGLLERCFRHRPIGRWFAARGAGGGQLHYKRRWSYFLLFTDFVPGIWSEDGTPREPSELKSIDVVEGVDPRVVLAVFSSSLFWWYFSVFTDNRNVNRRDLAAFPMPDLTPAAAASLAELGGELMTALHACAEVRTCTYRSIGTIRNTYFRQGATRPVVDRIDSALAQAFEMSVDELAFIHGFERRFRS